MFGAIMTVAYSVMLVYVLWRSSSVPILASRLSSKGFLAVGSVLWVLFTLQRLLGDHGAGTVAFIFDLVGMGVLASFFLISIPLLFVDIVTLFGFCFSTRAPVLRGYGLVVGILLTAFALIQGHRAPEMVSYDVTVRGLPAALDGKVIVAVSDAHLGSQLGEEWFSERVKEIRAEKPEMVVFLGDMFEGHGDAPRDLPSLRALEAPMGKWFVAGNHESHGNGGSGNDVLERAGFQRLANRWVEPVPGLVLAGVNDLGRRHSQEPAPIGDPLGLSLAGRPTGATVLLSHTPVQAERAAREGVGLMLSGHTHGGQIWPFGYLVQTEFPLFAGRYDVDGMTVIVSRGTGYWGPRMRLWHRSEILKVTIRVADGPDPPNPK